MEIILSLFLVGFILGTFYLHIEFWIDIVGVEHNEKNYTYYAFHTSILSYFWNNRID